MNNSFQLNIWKYISKNLAFVDTGVYKTASSLYPQLSWLRYTGVTTVDRLLCVCLLEQFCPLTPAAKLAWCVAWTGPDWHRHLWVSRHCLPVTCPVSPVFSRPWPGSLLFRHPHPSSPPTASPALPLETLSVSVAFFLFIYLLILIFVLNPPCLPQKMSIWKCHLLS